MVVADTAKLTTPPKRSKFSLKNKKNAIATPSIANLLRLRTKSLNISTSQLGVHYATTMALSSTLQVTAKPKAEH